MDLVGSSSGAIPRVNHTKNYENGILASGRVMTSHTKSTRTLCVCILMQCIAVFCVCCKVF